MSGNIFGSNFGCSVGTWVNQDDKVLNLINVLTRVVFMQVFEQYWFEGSNLALRKTQLLLTMSIEYNFTVFEQKDWTLSLKLGHRCHHCILSPLRYYLMTFFFQKGIIFYFFSFFLPKNLLFHIRFSAVPPKQHFLLIDEHYMEWNIRFKDFFSNVSEFGSKFIPEGLWKCWGEVVIPALKKSNFGWSFGRFWKSTGTLTFVSLLARIFLEFKNFSWLSKLLLMCPDRNIFDNVFFEKIIPLML